MDALEAILSRRSIRRFTDQLITDEQIEKLMQAAMAAPSAHNEQPWHFIVIRDRQMLNEIPKFHPYAQMLTEAPVGICVCADLHLEKDKGVGYWIQDCAAATENILVAATGLGLGTCWLGVHPREERKEALARLLSLPDHVVPLCIIAVGHAAESKGPGARWKADRIHHDQW